MKISAVILNYNDAPTVKALTENICGYRQLDSIILVDNHSTDDSRTVLGELEETSKKVHTLFLDTNGGYGKGNNAGVRYAVEQCQADYVLISNPDVAFSEECLKKMAGILKNHEDVAVVTAQMEDAHYGTQKNAWPLHGFVGELLSMGPVSRRLFGSFLQYPERYFKNRKAVFADAVHGSLLMVKGEKFLECGGYDEGIFLYQEEAVLGQRVKNHGFKTVLLLNCTYRHEHSVSISKSFQGQLERQRLRENSVLYYLEHYLNAGNIKKAIARLWFFGIRMEIRAAGMITSIITKKGDVWK